MITWKTSNLQSENNIVCEEWLSSKKEREIVCVCVCGQGIFFGAKLRETRVGEETDMYSREARKV